MNMLAHLTQVESPAFALIYLLGVATGVVLSLVFARLRAR